MAAHTGGKIPACSSTMMTRHGCFGGWAAMHTWSRYKPFSFCVLFVETLPVPRQLQLTDDLLHAVPDTERNLTDQLPAFYEGPWAFKRGGVYYLMYPTLHHMEEGERLEYATAHAPQGPWTPRGAFEVY